MQVKVLVFGVLKDVLGREQESVELVPGATVRQLLEQYSSRHGRHARLWSSVAVAVNREYALPEQELREGDEVALLPPVSGGAPDGPVRSSHVAIVRQPIDTHALAEGVKRAEDGAVVVFDGIVRNHSRGRSTLFLDYEAYEDMALAEMRKLAAQALERFSVHGVTIVHRLGRLEIGESSVLIAVASAHRGQAFDACRWLIDTLKKTVPIWKKEHFTDGAVWADGEPFPPDVGSRPGAATR